MPKDTTLQKILIIGSGPIVIGQAAEFDYSGTQGCMALKEEGYKIVLVNNNPATIMTDTALADVVYCEPLTVDSLTAIIDKEQPDGLLANLGGQTALNLAVKLHEKGILSQYNVRLLGTSVDSIQKGEDREKFRQLMKELKQPIPDSIIVEHLELALQFSQLMGYPLIVRPAYTLGGRGGGIALTEETFIELIKTGLKASPINQVLVEKSIAGYKEIEYEVMRDSSGTCISVCNMENFDPVGIHTGDSIVVAPSQTLTDKEFHMLRTAAFKIISSLKVVGGCNIQFALDPKSQQYYVIEVNPRVSRSSALASKATGYPIAKIAAKLAVGYSLDELQNPLTGTTFTSFEPALDYVVIKFPRWPFDKFPQANRQLSTKMKATGEVMAIERTLEAAFHKAVRSLELPTRGITLPELKSLNFQELKDHLLQPTDIRFFAIVELIHQGLSLQDIHNWTKIDIFFLNIIKNIVQMEQYLEKKTIRTLTKDTLVKAKQLGFSDQTIADVIQSSENEIRKLKQTYVIQPSFKMVDTCAAEFEATTNYIYSTYYGLNEIPPLVDEKKALIIGSGPIRIGQGIEFDYSAVKAIQTLQDLGWKAIMVNNNPETVSTDYEIADRLYFEPITKESILAIIEHEQVEVVIVQFGGQTAINIAQELEEAGATLLGASSNLLDKLEDRERFYTLLDELNIPHILGITCQTVEEAIRTIKQQSFPILCRPSYVIGGKGMVKVSDEEELFNVLNQADTNQFPILLDEFKIGTEAEIDLVADGTHVFIPEIMEHIEPAGIHSGDSMAIFPAQSLSREVKKKICNYAQRIVKHLNYKGIMNIQFLIDHEEVFVIEVNPRASRTVPIISKVSGVSLVDMAIRVLVGELSFGFDTVFQPHLKQIAVKYPLFSTHALPELDQLLGPDMKSTGEGMCLGYSVEEALSKVFHHLVNPYHIKEFCLIETDHFEFDPGLSKTILFDEWIEMKEAKIYVNDCHTEEAKKRRIKALEYGITVFSQKETFLAYIDSLQVKHQEPIPLPRDLSVKKQGFLFS